LGWECDPQWDGGGGKMLKKEKIAMVAMLPVMTEGGF